MSVTADFVNQLSRRHKAASDAFQLLRSINHGTDTLWARNVRITYHDPHWDYTVTIRPGGGDYGAPDPAWSDMEAVMHKVLNRLEREAGVEETP